MYVGGLAVLQPRVQNGKVKIIAVTNSVRIPNEPDIPTVVEAGFPALAGWLGWLVRNAGNDR